jgi:hypothetical protein
MLHLLVYVWRDEPPHRLIGREMKRIKQHNHGKLIFFFLPQVRAQRLT